ncbi:hypothetical protein FHX82_006080 [Amycolatopsis bartoniae]|uniref:hypothetical protein n=1 Tax=Amycolatopsis bartoniae TaxID=941986 RepID=UPI00119615C2|nr:hypothetical protein [Amycolatopsis bartoniae]MBB2938994.1 hypothetical protein [Amycolatopsis bartoniae]TVT04249.1 hypothetical protein FNH07_24215 [Amycolatopsis bartoniae]
MVLNGRFVACHDRIVRPRAAAGEGSQPIGGSPDGFRRTAEERPHGTVAVARYDHQRVIPPDLDPVRLGAPVSGVVLVPGESYVDVQPAAELVPVSGSGL